MVIFLTWNANNDRVMPSGMRTALEMQYLNCCTNVKLSASCKTTPSISLISDSILKMNYFEEK